MNESYEKKVMEILHKEGGAAGVKALRQAFPKKTSRENAESMLAEMNNVTQQKDGDYILDTGSVSLCSECGKEVQATWKVCPHCAAPQ